MGWDYLEWDGMGWNGMGWEGMGWDGIGWNDRQIDRKHYLITVTLFENYNMSTLHFLSSPQKP